PADVRGAPVDVRLRLEVEDGPVRVGGLDEVAARRVEDALRLPGRPGGVEDVERVLGLDVDGCEVGALAGDDLVPPDVPAVLPGDVLAGAADDEDLADRGVPVAQRLVDGRLERARLAAAVAAV